MTSLSNLQWAYVRLYGVMEVFPAANKWKLEEHFFRVAAEDWEDALHNKVIVRPSSLGSYVAQKVAEGVRFIAYDLQEPPVLPYQNPILRPVQQVTDVGLALIEGRAYLNQVSAESLFDCTVISPWGYVPLHSWPEYKAKLAAVAQPSPKPPVVHHNDWIESIDKDELARRAWAATKSLI